MDEQFSLCLTASLSPSLVFVCAMATQTRSFTNFVIVANIFTLPLLMELMEKFGNSGNYYCVFWAPAAHFLSVLCVCTQKNLNTYICLCVCLLHAKKTKKQIEVSRFFLQFSTLFTYYWGCKPKWWQQRRRFFRNITTATAQPINRAQIENE